MAPEFPEYSAAQVLDAEGGYVTPAGVDAHVHIDSQGPLMTCQDSFESGTRSAVCGGTTTVITFAVQDGESLVESWKKYVSLADGTTYCDYATHLIVIRPDRKVLNRELPELLTDYGVSSVKVYMTYAGMMLRDHELMDVMSLCRRHGVTVLLHAESGDMIGWMTERLEEQNKVKPFYHGVSRPPIIEEEATNRALVMSGLLDTPILFVHMSAPGAVAVLRKAQTEGFPVFAETCPQYLFLSDDGMMPTANDDFHGAKCVCSPPLRRDKKDQEALWNGLRNGTFTILSSDHAPVNYESQLGKKLAFQKSPDGRFRHIPNGLPGVETRMPLLFAAVEDGKLPVEKFVELLCTNPAKLYGMYPKKGGLVPGQSDADLCIWYPKGKMNPFVLKNHHLHHDIDYTPYEGFSFKNWPRYTLQRGKVVWREGTIVGNRGDGQFIRRGKSVMAKPANKWLGEWRPMSE